MKKLLCIVVLILFAHLNIIGQNQNTCNELPDKILADIQWLEKYSMYKYEKEWFEKSFVFMRVVMFCPRLKERYTAIQGKLSVLREISNVKNYIYSPFLSAAFTAGFLKNGMQDKENKLSNITLAKDGILGIIAAYKANMADGYKKKNTKVEILMKLEAEGKLEQYLTTQLGQ